MNYDQIEKAKEAMVLSPSFKSNFLDADVGRQRRIVIHDFITDHFGRQAREESSLLERGEIAEWLHQYYTTGSTNPVALTTNQGIDMNPATTTPAIETKTYIFGQLAANVSDDEVFSQIARLEAQIAALDKTVNKPVKLVAKIAGLNADIAALIAFVDARP